MFRLTDSWVGGRLTEMRMMKVGMGMMAWFSVQFLPLTVLVILSNLIISMGICRTVLQLISLTQFQHYQTKPYLYG
jgi:hypothetical protein